MSEHNSTKTYSSEFLERFWKAVSAFHLNKKYFKASKNSKKNTVKVSAVMSTPFGQFVVH